MSSHSAAAAGSAAAGAATTGLAGGYYHFDSKGNKLKNKWDSFDVDAALEAVDADEPKATKPATKAGAGGKAVGRAEPVAPLRVAVEQEDLLLRLGLVDRVRQRLPLGGVVWDHGGVHALGLSGAGEEQEGKGEREAHGVRGGIGRS